MENKRPEPDVYLNGIRQQCGPDYTLQRLSVRERVAARLMGESAGIVVPGSEEWTVLFNVKPTRGDTVEVYIYGARKHLCNNIVEIDEGILRKHDRTVNRTGVPGPF